MTTVTPDPSVPFEASGNSAVIALYPGGEAEHLDMDSPAERERYAALDPCVARIELMTSKSTPSYEGAYVTAFAGEGRNRFELLVPAGYTARLTGDFAALNPDGDVMVAIDADSPHNAGEVRLDGDLNLTRPSQLDPDRLRLAPPGGGHGLFVDMDDHYLTRIDARTADGHAISARMPSPGARYVASYEDGMTLGGSAVLAPDHTGRFVGYDPDTAAGRMAIAMLPIGTPTVKVLTDRNDAWTSPYDTTVRESGAGLEVVTEIGCNVAVEGDLTALEGRSLTVRAEEPPYRDAAYDKANGAVALSALAARTQHTLTGGAVAIEGMRVERDPARAMAWADAAGIPPRTNAAGPATKAPEAVQGALDLGLD